MKETKEIEEMEVWVPADFEVGTWTKSGEFRLARGMLLCEKKDGFYLAYLGSPRNRFVSEEMFERISEEDYRKGIAMELDWKYFHERYLSSN